MARPDPPGPCKADALLPVLRQHARRCATIAYVMVDGECASERHHRYMRQDLGALSMIPATLGNVTWHVHAIRAQLRADVPHQHYRQRVGIETLVSTTKRKLSARASGRSTATQQRQVLVLEVTYNRYRPRFATLLLLCLQDVNKAKPSHKARLPACGQPPG